MKARDLRVGDEVSVRKDLQHGRVGKVVRIENRFGHSSFKNIYFEGCRRPVRMHKMTEISISNQLPPKGFGG